MTVDSLTDRARQVALSDFERGNAVSEAVRERLELPPVCTDCGADWGGGGRNANGGDVCEACAEDYCTCERCDSTVHNDYVRNVDHETWCEGCVDTCAYYWESDECYHVEPEPEEEKNGRMAYSTDVLDELGRNYVALEQGQLVRRPLVRDGAYVGLEIEMETGLHADEVHDLLRSGSFAIAKEDGSLSDDGLELVTLPMTIEAAKHFVARMDALRGKAWSFNGTDGRCGVHIHLSRRPLTEVQRQVIDYVVAHADNKALTEFIARRSAGQYCRNHEKSKSELGTDCGEGHYGAVSVSQGQPTLELRIYKGTVASRGLLMYLEHVESLLKFSKEVSDFYKGVMFEDAIATNEGVVVNDPRELPDSVSYLQWLKLQPEGAYTVLREHLKGFQGFRLTNQNTIADL